MGLYLHFVVFVVGSLLFLAGAIEGLKQQGLKGRLHSLYMMNLGIGIMFVPIGTMAFTVWSK